MLDLKNNSILAALKLGYSDSSGQVLARHIEFYKKRNKHIGAITVEPLYMDKGLRELPTQLGIDNDDKIRGLQKLNDTIHEYGAKSIAHLNHPGRMANPKIPGNYWWSSTEKVCEPGGPIPKKMSQDMVNVVIDLFVDSAKRAVKAGFDIIELQFGHGYLMSQFLSQSVNNRTDKYGGDFERRVSFPIELAKAVRKAIDIPIIARISADEMFSQGFHIEEMILFSSMLENIGIDALHVTVGSLCSTPPWFFQHMFTKKGKSWDFAGQIKANVNIPVIFVGRVNSIKDINELKNKYNADYIAIGRAMIADSDFVGKYLKEIQGLIRPCLACEEGCLGGVKSGKGLGCVVNPEMDIDYTPNTSHTTPKRYAVIGGGLAGMQAAITLRENGHYVDLYEKNKLGGQFNLASLPPNKGTLKNIVDYYIEKLKEKKANKIKIINDEAISDLIKKEDYNGIIMATGAVPNIPNIKGLKEYYWTEFLDDEQLPKNSKVLIIGGGLIGLEVASKLVDNDNKVIIVEMIDEIGKGMEMIEKKLTIKKLKLKSTEFFTNCKVIEVDIDKVIMQCESGKKDISEVDRIVVAIGMKSYIPFELDNDIPLFYIGDAKKVGKAQNAIHEAYKLVSHY